MPQSNYDVNINVRMKDQTSQPARQAAKGLAGVASAAQAVASAMAVQQVVRYTAELAKLGATAQRQETALNSLASAAGSSGSEIIGAIREASGYTIDRMTAMEKANRALVMDVAKTPKEFERLTKVAVALGRAMGQDATKSIDDFVTAAGRQSKLIADNLGLVVDAETAYLRYAESIGKTAEQLTDAERKQAFLNEMLVQGEAKMAAMGEATLDNAAKIEQATATWQTFKSVVGVGVVDALLGAFGGLDRVNQLLDEHGDKLSKVVQFALAFSLQSDGVVKAANNVANAFIGSNETVDSATTSYTAMAQAAAQGQGHLLGMSEAAAASVEGMEAHTEAAQDAALAQLDLAAKLKDASDAMIAQSAIGQLKQALEEGEITFEQYQTAVSEVQLAFGLATPESVKLADSLMDLTRQLADGTLKASDYDEALWGVIAQSETAASAVDQFGDELNALPRYVEIEVKTKYTSEGSPPGEVNIPQHQHGTGFARGGLAMVGERGPEIVSLPRSAGVFNADQSRHMTNNYSLTVNSRQSSMGVAREFALMQALAAR